MNELIEDLRTIDTFAELSSEDLAGLAEICVPAQFPPRKIIAREGLDGEGLFALMTGTVGIWVNYGQKKADLLAVREAPCLVGEMSVADQLPRSATIVAGTPVAGYIVGAEAFRSLLQKRGSIALSLMKGISNLVRASNDVFISELRERNKELVKTNKVLVETQRQLVRQERLSSLGKFSSMIIHDLRNPLSVIRGYADMLEFKLDKHSPELQTYARHIQREASRLSGLTSELLDYSRGEIRLAYSAVSLQDLFHQLKENVESRLLAKNLNVSWVVAYDGDALLDVDRIIRVLINLTDNARKACDRGGSIEVAANREGDKLLLMVKDDGVGMDEEMMKHVFEPFYSTSDRGGTGLGMHIVKSIVDAHDGEVAVKSHVGEGTKITITLPLRL